MINKATGHKFPNEIQRLLPLAGLTCDDALEEMLQKKSDGKKNLPDPRTVKNILRLGDDNHKSKTKNPRPDSINKVLDYIQELIIERITPHGFDTSNFGGTSFKNITSSTDKNRVIKFVVEQITGLKNSTVVSKSIPIKKNFVYETEYHYPSPIDNLVMITSKIEWNGKLPIAPFLLLTQDTSELNEHFINPGCIYRDLLKLNTSESLEDVKKASTARLLYDNEYYPGIIDSNAFKKKKFLKFDFNVDKNAIDKGSADSKISICLHSFVSQETNEFPIQFSNYSVENFTASIDIRGASRIWGGMDLEFQMFEGHSIVEKNCLQTIFHYKKLPNNIVLRPKWSKSN